MKMETSERDGAVILAISGRIALGQNEITMRDRLRSLLDDGRKAIVLDLGDVTFMDSSGLAELITAHVTAERYKAEIKLANVGGSVAKLLDITKLSYVFEIFDSAEQAAGSFGERKIA